MYTAFTLSSISSHYQCDDDSLGAPLMPVWSSRLSSIVMRLLRQCVPRRSPAETNISSDAPLV